MVFYLPSAFQYVKLGTIQTMHTNPYTKRVIGLDNNIALLYITEYVWYCNLKRYYYKNATVMYIDAYAQLLLSVHYSVIILYLFSV